MKKFHFPLQKVLEYNTHIQKKEKDLLAQMHAEYKELEAELYSLLQKYESNKMNYLESCEMGTSIINASMLLRYLSEIDNQIKLMRQKMQEAQELINIQTEKLVEVTKDKTKVEKLRESKYSKYQFAERKSEELFIEEFVSYINSTAS
jgi:flagellar FliJ protein